MLALTGYLMVFLFMYLIMSKKMPTLIALMIIPVLFAVFTGHASEMGHMALEGIKDLAPTGIMLLFAILYFGIMIDAGLFDPIVTRILKAVKGDPAKIVMGTAVLALVVSLDGDGTTSYMITVSAFLPLYRRLNMNPLILPGITVMSVSLTNMVPWGGPTARAAAALGVDAGDVFVPLIPSMIGGAVWILFTAFWLGRRERKRLGVIPLDEKGIKNLQKESSPEGDTSLKRPKLLWANAILTVLLLIGLIKGIMPLPVLFMLAFSLAVMINYPDPEQQKERLASHAGNALAVVSLVFAAGIFTGILSGTKMVDAMASSLISIIPDSWGPAFHLIIAVTSIPFTFFMSNDAYYFGVVPILAEAAASYGYSAVEIARASLLGQPVHLLSPLVPATYLLVGMSKVDFGEFQRFTILWAIGTAMATIITALATKVIF
ncbi:MULTISPECIES: CitMHS family transporter [Thermoactinomyces]|uniref:CitMHS family transporter n=1 Tax=Thermoactinomyces vulgaris TaxID=2026 RepID=A0ABS0QHA9_THEVU|nr:MULTISPECIES: CitMHS family transporter [Thermoactinomyces]KFZ40273.1 citrate transporter [Thermoactinomyces sp. Gus2-1]MBA4550897.1 CitMHS family transporter [Thermoactinomyces vulgaris]MBA4596044.1 CitMHS family transporter [Thermoactinomyces vulgaris]MBH8583225.1 CitMHS family transporter [Thermoactinomyces sp. CICC 10735]MBH8588673.1 CitMHS family transporter [Thermoactinomyces vulgaris]